MCLPSLHPPVFCAPTHYVQTLTHTHLRTYIHTHSCHPHRSQKPSLETVESPEYGREESPSPENFIQSPGDHVTSYVTTAVGHVTTTTAMEQGLVAAVQNHVTSHVTTSKDHKPSNEITSTGKEHGHVTTKVEQGVQMEPQVQEAEELQDQKRLKDEEDDSCEVRALNSLAYLALFQCYPTRLCAVLIAPPLQVVGSMPMPHVPF